MARHRKVRRTHRSKKRSQRKSHRKQQHGGAWGFTGPAGVAAAGAPYETRTSYDHCYGDMRTAPSVNPVGVMQSGGACGCMAQPPMVQQGGGSGTGGFGFVLDNTLNGVYAGITRGACPSSVQTGGGPGAPAELVSYSAGYGFGPAGVVQSPSATYLDRSDYGRTCQGGGRRSRSKKNCSRRGRKTGRRHH